MAYRARIRSFIRPSLVNPKSAMMLPRPLHTHPKLSSQSQENGLACFQPSASPLTISSLLLIFTFILLFLSNTSPLRNSSGSKVLVHFINQSGIKSSVFVTEGESLLDAVIKKNLDISGFGACEGTLACSTCHLIFEESVYDKLEPVVDEEIDMLDLAYGLTKTSRLGCQVTVDRWMDGMTVCVPKEIKDQRGKQEAQISK